MSLHINRFLDTVRVAESRGQRDIHLTLAEARDLQRDITKLLLSLESALSRLSSQQNITVEVQGGSFRDS
jgi:hypothetical protein